MKKINVFLLIFSFVLSGIGGIFLFGASATQQSIISGNAPVEEITEYTYKTYEDYFIDYFNLPEEVYTRDAETNTPTINYSLITRKNENGETKLSYNGNIFYVVTSEDLTGTGSEVDPYIVHSTNGFLYISNKNISNLTFANKYIEINCDIFLNDEVFNKEGRPSGGDGFVYNWTEILSTFTSSTIEGNGHIIHGLFDVNKNHKYGASLFGYTSGIPIKLIKGLHLKNLYFDVNNGQTFTNSINIIEDCSVSGNIKAQKSFTIFCGTVTQILNCKNFANAHGKGEQVSGFTNTLRNNGVIENCENYGNIVGEGIKTSGFISDGVYCGTNLTLLNCVNYGNITGDAYVGGFVSGNQASSNVFNFNNCVNKGNIVSKNNNTAGGFIGLASSKLTFLNCANEGKIKGISAGSGSQLLGNAISYSEASKLDILIEGCSFLGEQSILWSVTSNNIKSQVVFKDCIFKTQSTQLTEAIIRSTNYKKFEISVINMQIDCGSNNMLRMFRDVTSADITLKNVVMNIDNDVQGIDYVCLYKYSTLKGNYIVKGNNGGLYAGTDFSGFYYSWKLGKIGLVALDGRGQFQGTIDEEWLVSRGFEKKTV